MLAAAMVLATLRIVIRRASQGDRLWIQQVAAEVYGELGDYGQIIPSWIDHPGVLAYVEEDEAAQELRGFLLLGFYETLEPLNGFVADVLAIAVAPSFQRRGLGRKLLSHAISLAEMANRRSRVGEIRLTVADSNRAGRHLYTSSGFRVLDEQHGHYDGGQRAIRMGRRL